MLLTVPIMYDRWLALNASRLKVDAATAWRCDDGACKKGWVGGWYRVFERGLLQGVEKGA